MKKNLLLAMMLCVWTFQAQEEGDNCPVVEEVSQSFCESEGEGNNFYRPSVQHLSATANGEGIVWYDTADSTQPLSMNEVLVNGEDYYAGNASGSCEDRAMVVVTVNNSPNAGGTTLFSIAANAEPIDLLEVYEPSILGAPEAGGTVEPPLASGTTIFDPAVDSGGQYRYTVASPNNICPDDSSYIYVTVVPEGQNPGDDPGEENCPSVDFTEQVFCESQGEGNNFYRPSVAHLSASADGDAIVWYDTATSETALSADEVLVNGEDYFAGTASGNCSERIRVVAVVNDSPNAGGTTFITFCSNAEPQDLLEFYNPSILGEVDGGGWVEPPLQSGTTVFDPSVDAAGQYVYHVSSTNDFCPDDSSVIYVSISETASAGDDIEVNFTQSDGPVDLNTETGATVGAQYSWEPPLASGTGIFDPSVDAAGQYILTVYNEEGCPDDTATVIVNVNGQGDDVQNCPIVEFDTQVFCESQGEGNNFYRPSVAHLEATANGEEIRWYDTELSGEPLSSGEILVDGEDYWAGNASGTCSERQRVVVNVKDSPNAGKTTFITVNSTDAPFDLLDYYEESILGAPDAGGVVEPPLASGGTIFNPALDAGGQYTYTVASTTDCPDDRSFCTITVVQVGEDAQAQNSDDDSTVALFPNPSQGQVNLSLAEGVSASSVRIFDLNGNTVKTMSLDSSLQLQDLDLSSLRPSIYFAEIVTDQGKVVKRIIKQ